MSGHLLIDPDRLTPAQRAQCAAWEQDGLAWLHPAGWWWAVEHEWPRAFRDHLVGQGWPVAALEVAR